MKDPDTLDQTELAIVVRRIRDLLYADTGGLDPDKPWPVGVLDDIAGVLADADLVPQYSDE